MTTDPSLPLPESLIELLAAAIRSGADPFDRGQEYAAAAHVLDALSAHVFPALAGNAQQMVGIVMAQKREAAAAVDVLSDALTEAIAAFDPPNGNTPGVNGYIENAVIDRWRAQLAAIKP